MLKKGIRCQSQTLALFDESEANVFSFAFKLSSRKTKSKTRKYLISYAGKNARFTVSLFQASVNKHCLKGGTLTKKSKSK